MSEFISKLRNSGEVSSEQAEFCQEVGIWCIEPIFTNKIMEVMTLLGDPKVLTDGTAEHQFEAEYFVNGARFCAVWSDVEAGSRAKLRRRNRRLS